MWQIKSESVLPEQAEQVTKHFEFGTREVWGEDVARRLHVFIVSAQTHLRLLLVSVVWKTLDADMRFSMYWPRTWFSDFNFKFSSLTASTRADRSATNREVVLFLLRNCPQGKMMMMNKSWRITCRNVEFEPLAVAQAQGSPSWCPHPPGSPPRTTWARDNPTVVMSEQSCRCDHSKISTWAEI